MPPRLPSTVASPKRTSSGGCLLLVEGWRVVEGPPISENPPSWRAVSHLVFGMAPVSGISQG
jgi:hypothetical protein